MDLDVTTLQGKPSGKVSVSDSVFGLEPRTDILHRMVRYQRAKSRSGSHSVQGRSDVNRTGARLYRQKGTGGARHHSASAPQFRGGGKAHGPHVRDHSHKLPKKVRRLALRHALSTKAKSGGLVVIDELVTKDSKTSTLKKMLGALGLENVLVIGGSELDRNLVLASRNLPNVDVLPVQGLNVYDILRHKQLVLSKAAVSSIEERFDERT